MDTKLKELRKKVNRFNSVSAKLEELNSQHASLKEKERELDKVRSKEQTDVERLEGRSLTSFFYAMVGKKEAKMDKEQQEAYVAAVKYDTALAELKAKEEDIVFLENELRSLEGCEEEMQEALKEKSIWLKNNNPDTADKIMKHEERIAYLQGQIKEIGEASVVGQRAYQEAEEINDELDSAESWGTWDVFGGGLITDLEKHSHLDEAQSKINHLQTLLSKFKTELADVSISADMQVQIDGFLKFADYFWDGLFTDWTVLDSIHSSQEQMNQVTNMISETLEHLEKKRNAAENEYKTEEAALGELIEKSEG